MDFPNRQCPVHCPSFRSCQFFPQSIVSEENRGANEVDTGLLDPQCNRLAMKYLDYAAYNEMAPLTSIVTHSLGAPTNLSGAPTDRKVTFQSH